jgi:hypothetical protein
MGKLLEFVSATLSAAHTFAYRRAARILRHFPYLPVREGEGEEDDAEWLVVRPSLIPNAGNGLFVTRFCAAGSVLCEYQGTRLTGLQLLRTPDWTYIYCYEYRFWIDAREHPKVKARFINDHFDPSKRNVQWAHRDGRVFLEAARDILPEEELYVEYGDQYWADHAYWHATT